MIVIVPYIEKKARGSVVMWFTVMSEVVTKVATELFGLLGIAAAIVAFQCKNHRSLIRPDIKEHEK